MRWPNHALLNRDVLNQGQHWCSACLTVEQKPRQIRHIGEDEAVAHTAADVLPHVVVDSFVAPIGHAWGRKGFEIPSLVTIQKVHRIMWVFGALVYDMAISDPAEEGCHGTYTVWATDNSDLAEVLERPVPAFTVVVLSLVIGIHSGREVYLQQALFILWCILPDRRRTCDG